MLLQHARAIAGKQSVTRPGVGRLSIAACSFFLSCITTILIARALTPSAFGVYMFVLWLATVAVPAIGTGTTPLTSRYIAEIQGHEEPRLVAGIFHFVWRRQYRGILLYCLVYLLLAWPLSWFFGASSPLLFLLLAGLSALPQLLSGVAGTTLRGLRRFDLLAAIHLFGVVAMLLLVLLTIQERTNITGALLLSSAITTTVTLAIAIICILRLLPGRDAVAPSVLLQDRLTRGLNHSLLLFTLDVVVWQRGTMLLLARGHTTAETGFYALSLLVSSNVIDIAPTLLVTCVLPLLLRYVPGQRYTSASDAFLKMSRYVALLAIPICMVAIIFCPAIVSFCFGNAYLPVVLPLRLLLVAAAFGSIATVSLTHLANGERKQAQIKLGLFTATLNILLAVPFIALWGVPGAALATAIAQIVSAVGSMLICKKLIFG